MADFVLNIYDFSGAWDDEDLLGLSSRDFLGNPSMDSGEVAVRYIDCRDIEGTNCYCTEEAREEILRRMDSGGGRGKVTVNWIDTGDYHYLSYLTISRAAKRIGSSMRESGLSAEDLKSSYSSEKLTVILFDHHPDMQEPAFGGGILSCGGWLRSLLEECPEVGKTIILGISKELRAECEGFGDRVAVLDEQQILQSQKEGKPCSELLSEILSPGIGKAYISIDKDVLGREWARTDWDHGTMDLKDILDSIAVIAAAGEIVGIDICGGITSGKGGAGEDFAMNRMTDRKILEASGLEALFGG